MKGPPSLFAGGLMGPMSPALRAQVEAIGSLVRYSDGQMIHQRGDAKPGLSIVAEGAVLISVTDSQGRRVTTTQMREGESFGEFTLFAGLPRTHDATAVGATRIRQISKPQFFALIDREPQLRDYLLSHLTRLLATTVTLLDDERRLTLKARIAKMLVAASPPSSQDRRLHITQTELAENFGVSRVAVGTALSELRAAGLIKTAYGALEIINAEALSEWVFGQTGLPPLDIADG